MKIRKLGWAAGLAVSLATASAVVLPSTPAFAQAMPIGDTFYYVTSSITLTMYNYGCGDGTYDAGHGNANRLTVLDFGGQYSDGSGTKTTKTLIKLTNAQLESIAEQYALGYYNCTGNNDTTSVLTVALGTNNSFQDISTSGGQTWAGDVAAVQSWVSSTGRGSQVLVNGANDIEPAWSSFSAAKAWADGYSSASNGSSFFYDFGSADGCPETAHSNGSCVNGWNQYDVWYSSWGAAAALPFPETYGNGQALEWTQLALYGQASQGGAIGIFGPLSEYKADNTTFTPPQSWNTLTTDLNNNGLSAVAGAMSFLGDMSYE